MNTSQKNERVSTDHLPEGERPLWDVVRENLQRYTNESSKTHHKISREAGFRDATILNRVTKGNGKARPASTGLLCATSEKDRWLGLDKIIILHSVRIRMKDDYFLSLCVVISIINEAKTIINVVVSTTVTLRTKPK